MNATRTVQEDGRRAGGAPKAEPDLEAGDGALGEESDDGLVSSWRRFSLADILLAIRWIEAGVKREHVARTLGVSKVTLRRWCRLWAASVPKTVGRRFAVQAAANQVHLDALRFVIDTHATPAEKEQFARLMGARFRLSPSRARRLLGLDPERARRTR